MSKPKQFFDINQLPQEEGVLVFGISMSKIAHEQDAESYFSHLKHFYEKIETTAGVGAVFLYGDYLYLLTQEEDPYTLHRRYTNLMTQHKQALLKKINHSHLVPQALSFLTWGQVIVDNPNFIDYFNKLKKKYNEDPDLQDHVKRDSGERTITESQIDFILQESLFFYLISKGKVQLKNDFLNGREQWILSCYPGNPLRTETYLYQENVFNLANKSNQYESSFYDLKNELLYDYTMIDMNNFPSHK